MDQEFNIEEGLQDEHMETIQNYMVWREHVGDIYDLLREKKLPSQSLTFDWLPENHAVIGTFTGEKKLLVVKPEVNVTPVWEKPLEKEANRARVWTKDEHSYIAVICGDGKVYVFEYNSDREPIKLEAHGDNGYALAWSSSGQLATGADDRTIAVWDIDFENWTGTLKHKVAVEFKNTEVEGINDLVWRGSQLIAACDDGMLRLFSDTLEPLKEVDADQGPINCVAGSPFAETLIATAGNKHSIAIWDTRDLSKPLHVMVGHTKGVVTLKFSPTIDGLLASAGEDQKVIVWDIRNIGINQEPDEAEEALPEYSFVHGGHVMIVNDISWHPTRPWVIASVSEDNSMQVWKPNELTTGESKKIPEIPSELI